MEEKEQLQEQEQKKEELVDKVLKESKETIAQIIEEGINPSNLDNLGKIIDIYKDMSNVKYWKVKEEDIMRYRESAYGNYGDESYGRRGVKGTGPYSRYRDGGSYGRRGIPGTGRGRYRGHEMLDDMYEDYQGYTEAKEDYRASGNYGAKDESVESLDRMLKGITEFMKCLKEDAESQEEVQLVEKYARKISEM